MLRRPPGIDPHIDDARVGHQEGLENPSEQHMAMIVSGAFMVMVGLNMPAILGGGSASTPDTALAIAASVTISQPTPSWGMILFHVFMVTVLSNLGKMFPAFCYRKEAAFRERLAVAIGMWPRGEVGTGVLVISISYGIGGLIITVAMLSLALNLLLTGVSILIGGKLIR